MENNQLNKDRRWYADAHLHSASFSQQERKNETLVHSIAELERKVGWGSCVPQCSHSIPRHQRGKGAKVVIGDPTCQRGLCWGGYYSPEAELHDLNKCHGSSLQVSDGRREWVIQGTQ